MKISVRNLEPTKVKLTVTVDPEEFNPYLDNARKEIAKQVNVPGFRKGELVAYVVVIKNNNNKQLSFTHLI